MRLFRRLAAFFIDQNNVWLSPRSLDYRHAALVNFARIAHHNLAVDIFTIWAIGGIRPNAAWRSLPPRQR